MSHRNFHWIIEEIGWAELDGAARGLNSIKISNEIFNHELKLTITHNL